MNSSAGEGTQTDRHKEEWRQWKDEMSESRSSILRSILRTITSTANERPTSVSSHDSFLSCSNFLRDGSAPHVQEQLDEVERLYVFLLVSSLEGMPDSVLMKPVITTIAVYASRHMIIHLSNPADAYKRLATAFCTRRSSVHSPCMAQFLHNFQYSRRSLTIIEY
jgi:hypothetical protein